MILMVFPGSMLGNGGSGKSGLGGGGTSWEHNQQGATGHAAQVWWPIAQHAAGASWAHAAQGGV